MLSPQILVADLLDDSPLVVRLLIDLHVDCLGCSMNKFCTLKDLCDLYELDYENVIRKVEKRINMHSD